MQVMKIDASGLEVSQILALLEIFEGFYGVRPNWNPLKKRLAAQDSWLLMDGEEIVGCAQLTGMHGFIDGALMLTKLVYRWEYGEEKHIHEMLQAIVDTYRFTASCLLLDVSRKHESNLDCYRRFGFQISLLPSPNGKENMVLIKKLKDTEAAK